MGLTFRAPTGTWPTTVNGTLSLTDSGINSDLKGGLLVCTNGTASGTSKPNFVTGLGIFAGSAQYTCGLFGTDAANPVAWRRQNATNTALLIPANGASPSATATEATGSTGITLTALTTTGLGELIGSLLFAGSDILDASVVTPAFVGTGGGETKTVSHGLGGAPTHFIAITHFSAATQSITGMLAIGVYSVGLNKKMCATQSRPSGNATENGTGGVSTTHFLTSLTASTDTGYNVDVANVTATTFDLVADATAGTDIIGVLCLRMQNFTDAMGTFTTATSTGTASKVTAMAAAPTMGLFLPLPATTVQTGAADADLNFNIGVACNTGSATQEWSSNGATDGGANDDNSSFHTGASIRTTNQAGAASTTASMAAGTWNSDGISPNWTVVQASGQIVPYWLVGPVASTASITNVNTTNTVQVGDTGKAVNGSGFGASQGAGTVTITDGIVTVAQTVTGWTATAITISVVQGGLKYGTTLTLTVTTNGAQVASKTITLNPATGRSYINFTTLRALTFDSNNLPTRIYDSPTDIPNNSQWEYPTAAGTPSADGTFVWPKAQTNMTHRYNAGGGTWTSLASWDLRGLPPAAGAAIGTLKASQGNAFSYDFSQNVTETDADSKPLSYALQSGNSGITFSGSVGSVTPGGALTNDANVARVTNADGTYVDLPFLFTVTVAATVTFAGPIPDQNVTVGQGIHVDSNPFFGNETAVTLTGTLPDGVTFNAGIIDGAPTGLNLAAATDGLTINKYFFPVFFTATNGVPSSAVSNTFSIIVSVPPVVIAPSIRLVKSPTLVSQEVGSQFRGNTQLPLEKAGICAASSSDLAGQTYRFIQLPSSAILYDLAICNESNPAGGIYNCGLFGAFNGGVVAPGADKVLFQNLSMDNPRLTYTSVYQPAIAGGTANIANLGLALWQLAGLPSDPSTQTVTVLYDVVVTAATPGQTGGQMVLKARYTIPSQLGNYP